MRLDFYYYSYQCPLNDNMLQLLAKYEDKIDIRYSSSTTVQNHMVLSILMMNKRLLGGADYLPSTVVPYDIPRDKQTAFLTCTYMSDSEYDYKSAPLRELERYLSKQYKRIVASSDEKGIFPNGDLNFFFYEMVILMKVLSIRILIIVHCILFQNI